MGNKVGTKTTGFKTMALKTNLGELYYKAIRLISLIRKPRILT
jgi:hypothetical protein